MLNNLGLGFLFTAKDLASGVMRKVKDNVEEVHGSASKAAKSMGKEFARFGTGLAVMGAGIAGLAILEPALREAKEFSAAIALVATESEEAVFPQEKMREVAEKLAVTYGKAPVDQAKALYKAVALGANDAAKSLDFLNGVNLLAVAGNSDLEMTANALGGALNAYGAPFSQATAYSDALFTAMKMGNTTVQDLASSIGRVTSSAANMNISIDEILGAVSVMTNKGVVAAEAVSGLKEALANVVHPSAAATQEAARLGIKFNQATLRAKGLQGFLEMITHSAKFNAESFSKLFTSVEGSNAIIQVASGNMQAFNDVMGAMKNKTGATQKGFDIITDTLDFQEKKFDANRKVMMGMIGGAIEPLATATLKFANKIMQAFAKIPKPVIAVATKIFLFGSVILTAIGGLIAAKAAIAMFILGLKAAGVTIGGLLVTMLPAIVALGALILAFYGFKQAYEKNFGGFKDFVDNVVAKVTLAFQALGQLFEQGGFSGAVREELNKAENSGVKQFAINVFAWGMRIKNFFTELSEGFSKGLEKASPSIDRMLTAFRRLGESLGFLSEGESAKEAASTFDKFGEIGGKVGDALAGAFGFVADIIGDLVDVGRGAVDMMKQMAPVTTMISDAFEGLGDQTRNMIDQLGIMNSKTGESRNGWQTFGAVIGAVVGGIGFAVGLLVSIIQMAVAVISGIAGAVHSLLSGIVDVFQGVVDIIQGIKNGEWTQVWYGIREIVFGVIDAIIGVVMEVAGVIGGLADSVGSLFGKKFGLQQGAQDLKNRQHNQMADLFGVTGSTGARKEYGTMGNIDMRSTGAIRTDLRGDNATIPSVAAAGASPTPPMSLEPLNGTLAQIAQKLDKDSTVHATIVVDGEVMGRVSAKAQKTDAMRSLQPLPSPT